MIKTLLKKIGNYFVDLYNEHKGFVNVILLILCAYLAVQNLRKDGKISYVNHIVTTERGNFSTWKDNLGREHAQIKVKTETITKIVPEWRDKIDTVAAMLGVAQNNIKQITEISSAAKGSFRAKVDSNRFKFNDGYLNLTGGLVTDTTQSITDIYGDYIYSDKATVTLYNKPKKFLGVKVGSSDYMDVHFDNPNTKISGLDGVYLKDPPAKRLGIGPTFGATYYTGKFRPYIGFGINYNLINIK